MNHEAHEEHEGGIEKLRALRALRGSKFRVSSAINEPNDYRGPGTGFRVEGARWEAIQRVPQARSPRDFIDGNIGQPLAKLHEVGPAKSVTQPEVVVAVGPAFGSALTRTIGGLEHEDVLAALLTGIAKEGLFGRVVKVYQSSDLAAISHVGAQLSGSGISVGLQSRGTAVIQKRGLPPLNNLELFPQSPSLTLQSYEQIGQNAARYARGLAVTPVPVQVDNWARLRLIVKTTLLHRRETEEVRDRTPVELWFDWEPDV